MFTTEGLKHAKDITLLGGTQITTWYIAIFNNDYTPTGSETYASPGFTESTDYSETTRPAWQGSEITSVLASNTANKATYTMQGTDTHIYGAALVSVATKGDTAGGGVMLCLDQFTTGVETGFGSGDQIKITVPVNQSDV